MESRQWDGANQKGSQKFSKIEKGSNVYLRSEAIYKRDEKMSKEGMSGRGNGIISEIYSSSGCLD